MLSFNKFTSGSRYLINKYNYNRHKNMFMLKTRCNIYFSMSPFSIGVSKSTLLITFTCGTSRVTISDKADKMPEKNLGVSSKN